jgi:hypothetical protein
MNTEKTLNTVAIVLILTLSMAGIIYLAYIMLH